MDKIPFTAINGLRYIDPGQFLIYLENRARLLAEKTAEPGLDQSTTELLRGERTALLLLHREIKEAT